MHSCACKYGVTHYLIFVLPIITAMGKLLLSSGAVRVCIEHRSQVSPVVVYSWNEYFERRFIEPAYSYTDPGLNPYYPLNLTANYTRQLNS